VLVGIEGPQHEDPMRGCPREFAKGYAMFHGSDILVGLLLVCANGD